MSLRCLSLVAIVVFISTEAVSDVVVVKTVDDEVSFRPVEPLPSPVTSIIWKHQTSDGTVTKAIEWGFDKAKVETTRLLLELDGITTFDKKTGEFTFTKLKVEHSGVYFSEINGKEQEQRFNLTVKDEVVMKAVDDQVSFRPDKPLPSPLTSIIWKLKTGDGTFVKAIEWEFENRKAETRIPSPIFKGVTTVDEKTGEITITNLKVEHSGVYFTEIKGEDQRIFTLIVKEPVPKPEIKIERSSDPNVVYLRCEYSEAIIWRNSAGETLMGSSLFPKGEFIRVKNKGSPENFYTCTLDNGVSKKTSDPVYVRDLFEEAVSDDVVMKAVDDQVSFRPVEPLPSPLTSIIWKHQTSDGTVTKAIEWEFDKGRTESPIFRGITMFDKKTGEITITNLKVKHSGVYFTEINGKEQEQRFTLTVKDVIVVKAVGDQVTFRPDKPLHSRFTSVIWRELKSYGPIIPVIQWAFDKGKVETRIPSPLFKGVTTVDEKTGEITITNLKHEHSGVYFTEISGKEQEQTFPLSVIESVPKPEIRIERSSDPNVAYLRCDYSKPIWKNSAGETLTGSSLFPEGEFITVNNEGNPENFYTCTLDNGATKMTSDPVYERDLFKSEVVMKAVGDQVSFHPDKPLPSPVTSIIWKHQTSDGTVTKAIEWEDGETTILNPRFKGVTTVDVKTGEITITNLKHEHSGDYSIEINGKDQRRFNLTVKESVPKPEIRIEWFGPPNVAHLRCDYSDAIWKNSAGETLPSYPIFPEGEFIKVNNEGNPENFYTCTLDNGVSKKTSDPVYERDLFKET